MSYPTKTSDALGGYKTRSKLTREKFQKASKVEQAYLKSLRQVTRQIDAIVKTFAPRGKVQNLEELNTALRKYAQLLKPWSRSVAARMIAEIKQRDEKAWATLGKNIGRNLRTEINGPTVGLAMEERLREQVRLITSLPIDAAERVHSLTMEGITTGTRAEEIAKEIYATGEVTLSRARTIARTEVARTASVLTEARSESVGSTHYIWRTSEDEDVRDSHRQMNGKVIPWSQAPTLSDGTTTHAGQIYNCRCWPEPILPEE